MAASLSALPTRSAQANLTIVPTWDSSITGDSQAGIIETSINAAIAAYAADFKDNVTETIIFKEMSTGLGQSEFYYYPEPYSTYLSALQSHATTPTDTTVLAHLPGGSTNPVNGSSTVDLAGPLGRALGLGTLAPDGQTDGTVLLNTSMLNLQAPYTQNSSKASLFAAVSHEIDECLGFGSALNGLSNSAPAPTGDISPEDLFRYNASGGRSFTTNINAASYFSLDGTTDLARFNQHAGGDFGDWYSYYGGVTPEVQDAYATNGAAPVLGVELTALDAIGYTPVVLRTIYWNFAAAGQSRPYQSNNWTYNSGATSPQQNDTLVINNGGTVNFFPTTANQFITLANTNTYGAYGQNLNVSNGQLVSNNSLGPVGDGYGIRMADQSSLSISGTGMVNLGGTLAIAAYANTAATVFISGGALNTNNNTGADTHFYVGEYGTGTLTQSGGAVNCNNFEVAEFSGSMGAFNFSGGTLTARGGANIGGDSGVNGGSAMVNISGSASFADQGPLLLYSNSNFSVKGGSVTAATLSFSTGGTYNQSGGTVTAGTTDFSNSSGAAFLSAGTLNTGSLNLGSNAAAFHWTGGTLGITGSGSNIGGTLVVPTGGTLNLSGAITSPVTVNPGGNFQMLPNSGSGILTRLLSTISIAPNPGAASGNGLIVVQSAGSHGNRQLILTAGLTIAGNTSAWQGLVNLSNNDMDDQATNLSTVTNQVKTGYANGNWNGSGGITSSAAAADASHLTALGVIQNNQSGSALYTAANPFDGTAPGTGDILLKFTYYGDTNLDGNVDGSDYSRLDFAYIADRSQPGAFTGWYNGDFNYDGLIDGSDYTLIDNAFNSQGASLAAAVASADGQIGAGSSVPEPTTLSLLGLAAVGVLGRRRRNN